MLQVKICTKTSEWRSLKFDLISYNQLIKKIFCPSSLDEQKTN